MTKKKPDNGKITLVDFMTPSVTKTKNYFGKGKYCIIQGPAGAESTLFESKTIK